MLNGRFDPETGAPIVAAVEAIVGTQLRARTSPHSDARPAGDGDATGAAGAGGEGGPADPAGEGRPGGAGGVAGDGGAGGVVGGGVAVDDRTVPQLQADALAMMCRHALGCDSTDVPTGGVTVVVRVDLAQLESGDGHGLIDGVTAPVSIGTVRRMAADARIIPCVLGGDSEILDFGRARRLFSPAQKLALVERDGGCVGCGLPPGMTQVHHIRWWTRDAGPTDLNNGVLLCVRCHHRIHDDGWQIRIDGAGVRGKVWLIPPAHVDPKRRPRLGGRARYDYALSA